MGIEEIVFSSAPSSRSDLGLPADWLIVEDWLSVADLAAAGQTTEQLSAPSKYGPDTGLFTWDTYPSKEIPSAPETAINIRLLRELVKKNADKLLEHELRRAYKTIDYLENGAPAHQKKVLKSCLVSNKIPSDEANAAVLNTVADWINAGFVAGPFRQPPLDNFRVNGMIAIMKGPKVRPVLNVSEPTGLSFNDNVDKLQVEKVTMDNAKTFSFTLLEAGKDARIDKTDVRNAFKNVPAKIEDLNLQGFMLDGRFFVEFRMIFGACTALANYDILGNTVEKLAIAESGIPRRFVRRAVDDQPTATPAGSSWGEKFVSTYKRICKDFNIELAEDCADCDKAFTNSKCGKVLGVWFRSSDLTWKLPDEKVTQYLHSISGIASSQAVTLADMQSLMGKMNFLCMMCPFLKSFRFNLNRELSKRIENDSLCAAIGKEAKAELMVHAKILEKGGWLPIARDLSAPPPSAVEFTSDAAGLPDNKKLLEKIGCAVVGFDSEGSMVLSLQYHWPHDFITVFKDEDGTRFGNKTTTLECIGMLLPLVTAPELMANRHVILKVDNIACVYGFENGQVKGDVTASIIIRAAKVIAAYLGTVIHVRHVKRRSCWEAELADNMTRESTTGFVERRALNRFAQRSLPVALSSWLSAPSSDWGLPASLLEHVKKIT